MADVIRIHTRSLALTTGTARRDRWVKRLVSGMHRARRRELEDYLRLHPNGVSADTTTDTRYTQAVWHGGGLL